MSEPTVLLERALPLATITLNRPDRLNAVSFELYQSLIDALSEIEDDATVKAIILRGNGRAFCAGADLKAPVTSNLSKEERRAYARAAQRANRALRKGKPIVAAVHGAAIGAGLELALSCDFVVVEDQARLRLPEVALGTFVGGGLVKELPRLVGLARARELLLLGDFITGVQATNRGLCHRAVPAAQVNDVATALATRLAHAAPIPLNRMRKLLRRSERMTLKKTMAAEARAHEACMASEDWKEGVRAFHEKRPPNFHGR